MFSDTDLQALRNKHVLGDEQIKNLYEYGKNFAKDYEDMNFTSPYLSTIKASTLLIQGDRDFVYPIDYHRNV